MSVSIHQLQAHLLKIWITQSVDQTYQNIFLNFLQTFKDSNKQTQQIQKQIKKTYEKTSLYFLLNENLELRNQIKLDLIQQLNKQEQQKKYYQKSNIQSLLNQICPKINNLRKINLLITENVMKIFQDYLIKIHENKSTVKKYIQIFLTLDADNELIKKSFLKQFINFQKGYDPFFLIQNQKNSKQSSKQISEYKAIQKLFDINISFVYRLMRAQQKMLKYVLLLESQQPQTQRKDLINKIQFQTKTNPIIKFNVGRQNVYLPKINKNERSQPPQIDNFSRASTIKQYRQRQIFGKARSSGEYDPINDSQQDDEQLIDSNRIRKLHSLRDDNNSNPSYRKQSIHPRVNKNNQYHTISRRIHTQEAQDNELTNSRLLSQRQNLLKSLKRKKTYETYNDYQDGYIDVKQQKRWNNRMLKNVKLKPITIQNQLEYQEEGSESQIKESYDSRPNKQQKKLSSYSQVIQPQRRSIKIYPHRKLTNLIKKPQISQQCSQEDQIQSQMQAFSEQDVINQLNEKKKPNIQYSKMEKQQKQKQKKKVKEPIRNQYQQKTHKHGINDNVRMRKFQALPKNQELQQYESKFYKNNKQQKTDNKQKKSIKGKLGIEQHKKKDKIQDSSPQCQKQKISTDELKKIQTLIEQDQQQYGLLQESQRQNEGIQQDQQKQPKQQIKNVEQHKQQIQQNNPNFTFNDIRTNQQNNELPLQQSKNEHIKQKQQLKNQNNDSLNNQPHHKSEKQIQKALVQSQSDSPSKSQTNIQIKMSPGKLLINDVKNYFKQKNILNYYKKTVAENYKSILNSIQITQTYLTQFTMNDKLAVFALSSPTSTGNILIQVWAPIQQVCDQKHSLFFFKKYLDYLQLSTTFKGIVYKGQQLPQLQKEGFIKQKQKYFIRKRTKPIIKQSLDFEQFFSMQFTIMTFKQESKESLFYSDEITAFNLENSWCNPQLIGSTKNSFPKTLEDFKIQQNIKSIQQVNQILQNDEYDDFQIDVKFKQIVKENITLCRTFVRGIPKSGFVSNQGFIIIIGKLIHDSEKKVVKTDMLNGVSLYLGSGFKQIDQMIKILGSQQKIEKESQSSKVAFKMFSKQFYGRYFPHNYDKLDQKQNQIACYGNWDISFAWRDQLPGKIIHDLQSIKHIFGNDNKKYYIVVEIKDTLICGFQVTQQDFLY